MQIVRRDTVNFYSNFSIGKIPEYNSKPNFKNVFPTKRKRRGYSIKYMVEDMCIRCDNSYKIVKLIDDLNLLGEDFIEICYEGGTHLYILTEKESQLGINIKFHGREINAHLETLYSQKNTMTYLKDFNMILLNEKYIGRNDFHFSIHAFAYAYEYIVTPKYIEQQLKKISKEHFTYLNKLYNTSKYSLKNYNKEYFPLFIESYFNPKLRPLLENQDIVMYYFIERILADYEYNLAEIENLKSIFYLFPLRFFPEKQLSLSYQYAK